MIERGGLSLVIRLIARMRGDERLEPHAVFEDPNEGWVWREIEPVALGIDDLRDEGNVGEPGCLALAETTGTRIACKQRFERLESCSDPMIVPARDRRVRRRQPGRSRRP